MIKYRRVAGTGDSVVTFKCGLCEMLASTTSTGFVTHVCEDYDKDAFLDQVIELVPSNKIETVMPILKPNALKFIQESDND